MLKTSPLSRGTSPAHARRVIAATIAAIVMLSSSPVASATGADELLDEVGSGQAMTMPAPFECGTEWQGTTYSGHGAHNWNLDLNRHDHEGTDVGEPILAQADGVVVWFKNSGYNNRAGTYIEIDYGQVTARYLHLVEGSIPDPLAEVGALVERGDVIGLLGATGRASGPHLHLEYWDSADYADTSRYDLPRANQLPVVFDGQEMIAEPGHPSPVAVSTNCPDDDDEAVDVEPATQVHERRLPAWVLGRMM